MNFPSAFYTDALGLSPVASTRVIEISLKILSRMKKIVRCAVRVFGASVGGRKNEITMRSPLLAGGVVVCVYREMCQHACQMQWDW